MDEKMMEILNKLVEGQERLEQGQQRLEQGYERLEHRVDKIETQLKENSQILRALEHKAEVSKAEMDKTAMDIAEIKGDVKGIREDLTNVELITSKNWNDIAKLKKAK